MSTNDSRRSPGKPSKQDQEVFFQQVETLPGIGSPRYFPEFQKSIPVASVEEVSKHLGRSVETIRDRLREVGMIPLRDSKDYSIDHIAVEPFAAALRELPAPPSEASIVRSVELDAAIDRVNSLPEEYRSEFLALYLRDFKSRASRPGRKEGEDVEA